MHAEYRLFIGKPAPSTIQAPSRVEVHARHAPSGDQTQHPRIGPWLRNEAASGAGRWRASGSERAAIGSTLLRAGGGSPAQ